MKKFILSLIVVLITISSYTQDSNPLLKNWTDLKTQFLVTSDAVKDMATLAMDSKKINISIIEKVKGFSFGLSQVIKILNERDKPGVQRISQFADSLNYYSAIIIKSIKNDQQFPSPKAYAEFEKAFLDANTKLEVYKYDFNQACKKINKPELVFPYKSNSEISFK